MPFNYARREGHPEVTLRMTPAEVDEAIRRIEVALARMTVPEGFTADSYIDMYEGSVGVRIAMRALHRDTGKATVVEAKRAIDPQFATDTELVFLTVRDMIHMLVTHEADEWLFVDGVRKWDPHA